MNRSQKKLRNKLWFVNAGILSSRLFNEAVGIISKDFNDVQQLNATLFLTIDYLIQYFEFASINSTKLINECIKRHLQFVEKFITIHNNHNRYLPSKYIDIIFTSFDKLCNVDDVIEKQFAIDNLERISHFLTTRTLYWVKSSDSFAYLKAFGRQYKNCVVYNSFLIPKFEEYRNPLADPDQKLFEKIESECHCKMFLDLEISDCRVGDNSMVLEVLFDWYKGNFVGFLDCLSYVVKFINPKKYFLKSLRTITRNEDMYYSILSDLPMKELFGIEKDCRVGEWIGPFLKPSAISKKIFKLLQPTESHVPNEFQKFFKENEDVVFWEKALTKHDFFKYKKLVQNFISDHYCWLIQCKEWKDFKSKFVMKPKPKFSFSHITEILSKSEGHSSDCIQEDIESSTDQEDLSKNNNTNKNNIEKSLGPYLNKSSEISLGMGPIFKVSLRELKSSYKTESFRQEDLESLFTVLHKRIYRTHDTPEDCLSHTLRVILRCDTTYDEADLDIAKLKMPPSTIHDLLKKFYNFDLRKQLFITPEQRKDSFLRRQKIRFDKEEKERLQYLETRRIVTEEIEQAEEESVTVSVSMEDPITPVLTKETTVLSEEVYELVFDKDVLFADFKEKVEELTPEFRKDITAMFGDLNGDILKLFNEKRIKDLPTWELEIKSQWDAFKDILPQKHKPIQCNATNSFHQQLTPDQIDLIHSNINTNIFVFLKLLSNHDPELDREFVKIIKGIGVELRFLTEINKSTGNFPKFFAHVNSKEAVYRKQLNFNLCVLSFDIYLSCASLNSGVAVIFDYHRQILLETLESSNKKVKSLFKLFEFDERLDEANSMFKLRLHNRTDEEIGTLLKLSQDIRRFNELIFQSQCCNWRRERSIRILYASMSIDGNKKCQIPFLRKGGDRRLKKIERRSNCMITMKLTTHPTTGVPIPFVEVFYDFFRGNHFCCMDMLRKMLVENRSSTARIVNIKHLVCLPYGELWVISDLEWLRTRVSFMLAQEITV